MALQKKDYNKWLDDIIFRYNLDAFYPKYRKMRWAENYLKIWVQNCLEEAGKDGSILCVALNSIDIGRFRFYTSHINCIHYYLCREEDKQELKEQTKNYEHIYIISYDKNGKIADWLNSEGVSFQSIYDLFWVNGTEFDDTFYHFLERDQEIRADLGADAEWLFDDNNYFLELLSLKKKQTNIDYVLILKKQVFLSLVFKDFVAWSKYQTELMKCLEEKEKRRYQQAEHDIKALLEELRYDLQQRKEKDILMIWLDAMSCGEEKYMPFLMKEMKKGIYFENAFTVVPSTMPTFRMCFTNRKDINAELHSHTYIEKENSLVHEAMKKNNYSFKVVSGYLKNDIDGAWYTGECLDKWAPLSLVFWNALCCVAEAEHPVFVVLHEIAHTHYPFFTDRLKSPWRITKRQMLERKIHAYANVDTQLEFYKNFFREDICTIYMSDHGAGEGEPWEQVHAVFSIKAPFIKPGTIAKMFSYKAFDKVAVQLMEGRWEPEEFTSDSVCVGAFPLYNAKLVKERIRNKNIKMSDLGYTGIVDQQFFYLKYNNGREVLINRKRLPYAIYIISHRNDICDRAKLAYFRDSSKAAEIDFENEKFQYSKYLFKIVDRLERFPKKKMDIINKWIKDSGKKHIAIRMGGDHSRVLYDWLTIENQEKIVCFIDKDKECICSDLKKKIISPDEMTEEIDGVILSSFRYLEEIRLEAQEYPSSIYVYDIYEYLTKEGFPHREILIDLVGMPDSGYEV